MEHLARQREITKAKPRDRNKGSTFKLRRFVVLHDKRVFTSICKAETSFTIGTHICHDLYNTKYII